MKDTIYRVTFHSSIEKALQELAYAQNDGDMGEALRDAVALSKWVYETRKRGGKFLIDYGDGKIKEFVLKVKHDR